MPTVPTSFVPQVGMTEGRQVPAQAFPVQPVENFAARQQIEFGQRSTEMGNVLFRTATALQDARDDAYARKAELSFLTDADKIVRGKNGYTRTFGEQADTSYESTTEALSQAAQKSMGMVENATQRAMLEPALARSFMNFTNNVNDHRQREVTKWSINESQAKSGRYAQLTINAVKSMDQVDKDGNPVGEFHENLGVSLQEMTKAGWAMGFSTNSEQMKELHTAVTTQVTEGVVNRLMLDNKYQKALDYVKAQTEAGNLKEDSAERLLSSVTANRKAQLVEDYTTTIRTTGYPMSTVDGYGLPVDNGRIDPTSGQGGNRGDRGVEITTDPSTPLKAPNDATVTKVKENDDGTYALTMTTPNGTALTFDNLPSKDLPPVKSVLTKGQAFGLVGTSGVVRYTARSGNGVNLNPMDLNAVGEQGDEKRTKAVSLRDQIDRAELIPDVAMRREVQNQLRSRFAQDEALKNKEYADNFNGVINILSTPGMKQSDVPKEMWGALEEKDRQALISDGLKNNSLDAEESIIRQPELLTETWLMENRDKLTRETYIKFLKQLQNPATIVKSQIDADQLNVLLMKRKLGSLVNPSSDADKERSILYRNEFKKAAENFEAFYKRPPNREEMDGVLDSVILNKAKVETSFLGVDAWATDPEMAIFEMTPADFFKAYREIDGRRVPLITIQERSDIRGQLRNQGLPSADEDVIEVFKEMKRAEAAKKARTK